MPALHANGNCSRYFYPKIAKLALSNPDEKVSNYCYNALKLLWSPLIKKPKFARTKNHPNYKCFHLVMHDLDRFDAITQ